MGNPVSAWDSLARIGEELPKWWMDPQQKDLRDTLGYIVPQSPAEVGLMMATGPLGKMAKTAGATLAATTYSPDAEAGLVPMLARQGTKLSASASKKLSELLDLFDKAKVGRKQVYEETGGIPLTTRKQDVLSVIPDGEFIKQPPNLEFMDRMHANLPYATTADKLYRNPTLFSGFPELKKTPVVLAPKEHVPLSNTTLTSEDSRGIYRFSDDKLGGLQSIWLRETPSSKQQLSSHWKDIDGEYSLFEHELFHPLQSLGRMSTDYSASLTSPLPWKSRLDEVVASIGAQRNTSPEKLIEQLDTVLGKLPRPSFSREKKPLALPEEDVMRLITQFNSAP